MATTPFPVDRSVSVSVPPPVAWALFTERLHEWWPLASHSCSGDKAARVTFEPRVGGEVIELGPDGRRHAWGTVAEWDPPHAFAMSWHPGQDATQATRLRVSFQAVGEGTAVRVWHEGWEARGARAQQIREEYDRGWPLVLQSLANRARGAPPASTRGST